MSVELAGVKLRHVHSISTIEQATFVYHRVPGLEGNAAQNLGRDSVRLRIEGIFFGPKASDELGKLRGLYLKRQPADCIAAVKGQSYGGKVTIDRFEVSEAAGEPDQYSFVLIVSEYVLPPKSATQTEAVQARLSANARSMMAIAGLPDALKLGSMPEITNPFVPLKNAIDPMREAASGLQAAMGGLTTLLMSSK